MNDKKGMLVELAEVIERHCHKFTVPKVEATQPGLLRFLRWCIPNGGTLLIVAILLMTQSLWARPQLAPNAPGPSATTVNYQGRLADNTGTPLDGTYAMRFSLYDAATEGTLIWGPEIHDAVPVSDGLFSVGLGSQTSGGIPTTTWNGDRYLEITVGGETLSPRELIRSVPIAGMALTVPDSAIGSRQLAPTWYENYNSTKISTTSTTDWVPTDVSVTFTCETDCTALVLHRGLIQHTAQNGRVDIGIEIDDNFEFGELGIVNVATSSGGGNKTFAPVSGFDFVNLPTGTHTVDVLFKCHPETPGTCYYYGDASNDWEHLNVLVFSQP